jgi:hypothetical protein
LLIPKRADCRCGRGAVLPQQLERLSFCGAVVLHRVSSIHRVDHVRGHAVHCFPCRNRLSQLDLNRIDARDVMYHYTNLPAVSRDAALPLDICKRTRKSLERQCA